MARIPAKPPSSWAEVCLLKPRLRQQAKESGYLSEWRRLDRAALNGTDTLAEWRELCARIVEHGAWYGTYAIRPDEDPADLTYACPNARRCDRRAAPDATGRGPTCHLSAEPMIRQAPDGPQEGRSR
jgi:hypothetical protein